MRVVILAALLLSMLSACSVDPRTEPPVALKPGLYDIEASGESYIEIEAGAKRANVCVTDFDAREFERFPMLHATRKVPYCSDTVEPRIGNLVVGKRRCTSGWMDTEETTSTYEVTFRKERVVIKGKVKDRRDGTGPNTGAFTVVARRIGDC